MHYASLSVQELGSTRLLVYKDDVTSLNFNLKMANILPIVRTTFIDTPICYFDITDKVSLSELQRYSLDKYDLLKVLKISTDVALYLTREGFGLDEILFDPDYVFIDSQFNAFFIPLRVRGNSMAEVKGFLKNIISSSIIDPKYTDNFVQLLLNCFNDSGFSLERLLQLVEEMLATKTYTLPDSLNMIIEPQNIHNDSPSENSVNEDERLSRFLAQHVQEQKEEEAKQKAQHLQSPPMAPNSPNAIQSGFAPVFISGGSHPNPEKVSAVSASPQPSFYTENSSPVSFPESSQPERYPPGTSVLYSAEDPKVPIPILVSPFRVGRNPDLVNYVINSPYVGRVHASIERDGTQYYVIDNNSTNGTFLNTYRLPPEQRVPLKDGDILRFAKHAFQFVIQ